MLWHLTVYTWLERISMFVIMANCITLAMYDPSDSKCKKSKCKVLEAIEIFVFAFFLLEMVVKMIAMGVIGKRGYLRDKWNRLDFVIVLVGWVFKIVHDIVFYTAVLSLLTPLQ